MNTIPTIIPDQLLKTDMDYAADSPSVIGGHMRRILTGMRPSGNLHLGHYAGAIRNWLEMQERFDCTFLIADLHAFADHNDQQEYVRACISEVALDWLACGIDPKKAYFMVQTGVPELENLTVLFETLVPLSVLQKNPTLKKELESMRDTQKTVSFHNYPVSEAADILGPLGDLIPAGDDQRPMIELTRSIARKMNEQFLSKRAFKLPVPQIYTGTSGRLRGTDGNNKMGKSLNNAINLTLSPKELHEKVKRIQSSPKQIEEQGAVEGHVVFEYLDVFHQDALELIDLKSEYQKGGMGEGHLKEILFRDLDALLEPIRERRMELKKRPEFVQDILKEGTKKARERVKETLEQIRDAMGLFS